MTASHALLIYERRTHQPTRIGNLRVVVDRDGSVTMQENREEPPRGSDWCVSRSGEIAGNAYDRLAQMLERSGFFDWQDIYRDEARKGGVMQSLAWHGSRAKMVTVDRVQMPEFDRLIGLLLVELTVHPRLSS